MLGTGEVQALPPAAIPQQTGVTNFGLVKVRNNEALFQEAQARRNMLQAAVQDQQPALSSLSSYLQLLWSRAKQAKIPIEQQMLKNLRQRYGQYEADKLAAIKKMGGSEVYVMLTATKCRAAEAWINDILRPIGERLFTLNPTPLADIPKDIEDSITSDVYTVLEMVLMQFQAMGYTPNLMHLGEEIRNYREELRDEQRRRIQEEARRRADRMTLKIDDQLAEGGWHEAFWQVISDLVTLKAGILKGPVVRRRLTYSWEQGPTGWDIKVDFALVTDYDRVSPFDFYPAPDMRDINDGYLFERHRLSRSDLSAMIGVPGYSEDSVRAALAAYGRAGRREWLSTDTERAMLEFGATDSLYNSDKIEALEFWGSVPGYTLLDWTRTFNMPLAGMTGDLDPEMEYEVNCWQVGEYTIRAIINPDKLGRKPYSIDSFERVPGSIWGKGLPELMSDIQDVCNALARAIVNNAGLASGPQVDVNTERCDDYEEIYPWKIWQATNQQMLEAPAVRFTQPQLIAHLLLPVYQSFVLIADDQTGVPRWSHGNTNIGGAGGTSSGLSMLMTSAARGIKEVISHIDRMVETAVERQYYYNMIYDPDDEIKGDSKIVARGSSSILAKEQRTARTGEFMQATMNPVDLQILGIAGRAKLLREWAKMLDIDLSDILPESQDELQKILARFQAYESQILSQAPNKTKQIASPKETGQKAPEQTLPDGQPAGGVDSNAFPNPPGVHP